MNNDSIDSIVDFSSTVPMVLNKRFIKEALINERNNLRNKDNKFGNDYIRIDVLNENIQKLDKTSNVYGTTNSLKDSIYLLKSIKEIANLNNCVMMEMDISNTLKVAIKNLKRGAMNLSDNEKKISSNIDVSVNAVMKSIESALKQDNRDAVIKGRLIPSASKTIKLALSSAVAWAVNPAIAVIGVIGYFGCMKKMQKKERQLILDDIEVELKMCERYINKYEGENDLKKVREVEKIKRNLERQKQRVKYKMSFEYGSDSVAPSDATPGDIVNNKYN